MAPSPASLLWAHQLKREHAYLLQRMQDLEAKTETHSARIAGAEDTGAAQSQNVTALSEQVKEIKDADSHVDARVGEMERQHLPQRLDDVRIQAEAVRGDISALQSGAEEERRQAQGRHELLLQQIGEVQVGLKKYERSLERMGKRLDAARFEGIREHLDGLGRQVREQGEQMLFLPESIRALEASNAELKRALAKNEADVCRLAAKAAVMGEVKEAAKLGETGGSAVSGAEREEEGGPRKKKKSHKWSGGGADRDVIRSGADFLLGSPPAVLRRSPELARMGEPKKRFLTPLAAKKKKVQHPIPRRSGIADASDPNVSKKPHKWAGGGADRDIVQAGLSLSPNSTRRRSNEDPGHSTGQKKYSIASPGASKHTVPSGSAAVSKEAPKSAPKTTTQIIRDRIANLTEAGPDEVVVRAGKGWIEVASPASVASLTPSVKRKRGRPRKEHITPQWTEEDVLTQGRATRRQVYQKPEPSTLPLERVTETMADDGETDDGLALKDERVAESPLPMATQDHRMEDSLDATTVVESSMPAEAKQKPASAATASHDTAEAMQIAPPPQRQIVQNEDLATFMAYQPKT